MRQIRITTLLLIFPLLISLSACGDQRLYKEVQESFEKGDYSKTKTATTTLINNYPKSKYASLAQEILQKIDLREAEEQRKRVEERLKQLIEALNNRDTRRDAIKELGEIGDKRAVEPLIEAFKYEKTKKEAIEALGKIRDERAVEPLIAILKNTEEGCSEREAAVFALGNIGDNRAIVPLVEAFKTRYCTYIGDKIESALITFGEPAVEPLIDLSRNLKKITFLLSWQCNVVEALRTIDEKRTVEPLISALKSDVDWRVRQCIAKALGIIGDDRAVTPLIDILVSLEKISWLSKKVEIEMAEDEVVEALEKITNQDFGRDSKQWKEWWKENKAKTKQ